MFPGIKLTKRLKPFFIFKRLFFKNLNFIETEFNLFRFYRDGKRFFCETQK